MNASTEMTTKAPLLIRMHPNDNVAVVVRDGGLPAGTDVGDGVVLAEHVPQAHKVVLKALRKGDAVRRYNVTIGFAKEDLAAGRWVNEHLMTMPEAVVLDTVPLATVHAAATEPLAGYTFEGYRNADG